jgi:hypothetical protein
LLIWEVKKLCKFRFFGGKLQGFKENINWEKISASGSILLLAQLLALWKIILIIKQYFLVILIYFFIISILIFLTGNSITKTIFCFVTV